MITDTLNHEMLVRYKPVVGLQNNFYLTPKPAVFKLSQLLAFVVDASLLASAVSFLEAKPLKKPEKVDLRVCLFVAPSDQHLTDDRSNRRLKTDS